MTLLYSWTSQQRKDTTSALCTSFKPRDNMVYIILVLMKRVDFQLIHWSPSEASFSDAQWLSMVYNLSVSNCTADFVAILFSMLFFPQHWALHQTMSSSDLDDGI